MVKNLGICNNNNNNNNPDWVSNGKQTARKCFQEDQKIKRAHRLTSLHTIHRDGTKICNRSVRGERANLKGLVLGCIEAKFCK